MLYKNTKIMIRSSDGDADFFDIVARVRKEVTLAPYFLYSAKTTYFETQQI